MNEKPLPKQKRPPPHRSLKSRPPHEWPAAPVRPTESPHPNLKFQTIPFSLARARVTRYTR